jgi:predicted ATPase
MTEHEPRFSLSFYSGPFGGKTTLARLLDHAGIHHWDADAERQMIDGWDDGLWLAWDYTHPRHAEWKVINDEFLRRKTAAHQAGTVVIDHAPVDKHSVLIYPGAAALYDRAKEYVESVLAKGLPYTEVSKKLRRVVAAVHYWSSHHAAADITNRERIKVPNADAAMEIVHSYNAVRSERKSDSTT